jgi:hypothetical protein
MFSLMTKIHLGISLFNGFTQSVEPRYVPRQCDNRKKYSVAKKETPE